MKKGFAVGLLLIIGLLLLAGCIQPTQAIIQTSVVTDTVILPATTSTVVKVIDPISGNEYMIKPGEVGTANADASVNNYFNGLDASWIGLILNGDDTEQQFNIYITPYSNDTVAPAPANIADWVTITNNNLVDGVLTVAPMSAASLYITLNVPSGVQLPQDWGFLVNVSQATGGDIVLSTPIRWVVHMRQP